MRIKRGIMAHKKHKALFERVKGFRMSKRKLVKLATEADLHAGQYAYAGRKIRKSEFRSLWITRISHAVKKFDISYNLFINKMKKTNIILDRKILSEFIMNDPEVFSAVVDKIKKV
jgi:large subunit ribosomal protein L20